LSHAACSVGVLLPLASSILLASSLLLTKAQLSSVLSSRGRSTSAREVAITRHLFSHLKHLQQFGLE